jgi:hypothetical protein
MFDQNSDTFTMLFFDKYDEMQENDCKSRTYDYEKI